MKVLLMIFAILALSIVVAPSAEAAGCNPGGTIWTDVDGGVNCIGRCVTGNWDPCLLDNVIPCRYTCT